MARKVRHADRLQQDFYRLADAMGVGVVYGWNFGRISGAYSAVISHANFLPTTGEVGLPHRIRNTAEYFVALHELGHLADQIRKDGQFRKYRPHPLLTSEYRAWNWALHHACVTPTKAVWRRIANSMGGYADAFSGDRRMRQDPDFYRLLERARKES